MKNNAGTWSYDNNTYLTSETDPVFLAHTVNNIIDGQGILKNNAGTWSYDNNTYLTSETDPVFLAHTVNNIIDGQGILKNNAGTWSYDNNTYLTGETDPIFAAHAASGISSNSIGQWNTAYGWGNHADEGYLTASSAVTYGNGLSLSNTNVLSINNSLAFDNINKNVVRLGTSLGTELSTVNIGGNNFAFEISPYFGGPNAYWVMMKFDWYHERIYYYRPFSYQSDDYLKSYESDIINATDLIIQLKPKKYKKHSNYWTDLPEPDLSGVEWFYEAGFIAQDLEKIPEFKYLVSENTIETTNAGTKEIKTVNYIEIIPYLVQSIKELHQKVTTLEATMQDLRK